MSTDHETIKSTTHERRDTERHDDDESEGKHHTSPETRAYHAQQAQKRVAQAAALDPKAAAHSVSDNETIDAVRATLAEHAALVSEASLQIKAAVLAKHDLYARQGAANDQSKIVMRAFDRLERYCQGVQLKPSQWSGQLPQSVTAVHRAFETFKEEMASATAVLGADDNVQDVENVLTKIHATTTVATTKASAATPVKKPHADLRVVAVKENLEAARDASASILAGNSGESRRLTAHLQLLTKAELTEVKKDPRAYANLKKVIGEVVQNLNALTGRYPTDQNDSAIVKLFRDQL